MSGTTVSSTGPPPTGPTPGFTDGHGNYFFTDSGDKNFKFKASKDELTITFARKDLATLKAMSANQNDGFELLAYNVELDDYVGNPFDGIARLKVSPGKTIAFVVDKLNSKIDLTGWLQAMIQQPPGPPITRWFLPTFIVQMKEQYFSTASNTIEDWGLKILRRFWMNGFYSVSLPKANNLAPEENFFKTLFDYKQKEGVKFVEVDEISSHEDKHLDSTDPNFDEANGGWHHKSSDPDEIFSSTAWDDTRGHYNVVIAVVDTGVKYSHYDFVVEPQDYPDTWPTKFTTNWSYNGGGSGDTDGHGTKIAGVAAAFANFAPELGFGVAGVAPHCRISRVKVPLGDSSTFAERANGIQWVKQKAIDYSGRRYIALLAWDTAGSDYGPIRTAIEEAHDEGVLIIASAGENNQEIGPGLFQQYPASYPDVLAVGSYRRNDKARNSNTNWGLSVVMAPGEQIAAPSITSDTAITTNNGGTSVAAAIVAGIAGLAWSWDYQNGGFSKTNDDIRTAISDNANTHVIAGYNNRGRPWAHQVLDAVI